MPKVSVIIPVYNVERYLSKCLKSVMDQTFKDLEIICIDDYSDDNSLSILMEYSKKDSRIIVMENKMNKGLGDTRNIGLRRAIGKYISFIDSDDYISNNFIEDLYNVTVKYDSDITGTLNIYVFLDKDIVPYQYNNIKKWREDNPDNAFEGQSNVSVQNICFGLKEYLNVMVWNKLWKKDFLDRYDLHFEQRDKGEDSDIFYRALAHHPKTSYCHKSIYYYRQRRDSITGFRGSSIDFILSSINYIKNNIEYYKKYSKDELPYLIDILIYNLIYELDNFNDKQQAYDYIRKFFINLDLNKDDFLYLRTYLKYEIIKSISNYEIYLFFDIKDKYYDMEMEGDYYSFKEDYYKFKEDFYEFKKDYHKFKSEYSQFMDGEFNKMRISFYKIERKYNRPYRIIRKIIPSKVLNFLRKKNIFPYD